MTRKDILNKVYNAYYSPYSTGFKRLYNCKAIIVHVDFTEWLILISCEKIVAAFQVSTGILWVFDFYSHTTAQHIAMFCKWLRNDYNNSWNYQRTVKLYNDSRTGKRAARKNLEDDFESVIATALSQQ